MVGETLDLARLTLASELEKLRDSIHEAVESLSEARLWAKPVDPGNSAGHLILHLTGNLNHFAGAQLGGTGYVRQREKEFTETSVPTKAELLKGLDEAVAGYRRVVSQLTPEQLSAPHPEIRFGKVYQALVHMLVHFAIHRGQISYIVRMVNQPGDK